MKKKLAVFASLVLILSVAAAGTYAYLTAQGMAHNVITAGNISVTLHDEGKNGEEWTDFNQLYPNGAGVMPGVTVDKRVYVENTGKNPCYVRVKLTPTATVNGDPLDTEGQFRLDMERYAQFWTLDDDGFYRCNTLLQPGEATEMLISSVTFDEQMGNEYQNARFDIVVDAQAVQGQNNDADPDVLAVKGWPETDVPEPSEIPSPMPPQTAVPVPSETVAESAPPETT